jgi:polysaccharide export outer membrane protein
MEFNRVNSFSSDRTATFRQKLFFSAVLLGGALLGGCAVVPGDRAYGMREQSAVKLPVKKQADQQQEPELVPENVDLRRIDAGLVIDLIKANQVQAPADAQDAVLKDVVRKSKPGADYKVGPGDILSIIVWDHPELTTPAGQYRTAEQAGTVVAEDGTIFYPYVGVVPVGGKTTRQIRELMISRLSRYIEKVQLDVRMAAYRSKRVYVVGEVAKPGLLQITDVPMTVLEAVNQSGGFSNEADHSQVLLTRNGTTFRVDIQSMYEAGRIDQNVLLQDGDILNIPDRAANKIFVLGEVSKPGSLVMNKRRSTLAEALSDAGYINQDRSNPRWIYVMRGGDGNPSLFHLDGSSPDAMLLADRFPLQPRDIIYVDAADVVRWNRVITNILPTAQMLYQTSNSKFPLLGGRQ